MIVVARRFRSGLKLIQAFALDEALGGSVGWIDEDNVGGIASRRVDRQNDERLFEDLRSTVDGALLEKDELAWTDFKRRCFAEEKCCATREDREVFVAGLVVVSLNWTV